MEKKYIYIYTHTHTHTHTHISIYLSIYIYIHTYIYIYTYTHTYTHIKNRTDFVQKSGSSNLLVNKIKFYCSIKNLSISVMSNDILLKSNVCVKFESVFPSNLQLMLPIVLSRVRISLTNWGQCRRKNSVDSISSPQLHNGLIVS